MVDHYRTRLLSSHVWPERNIEASFSQIIVSQCNCSSQHASMVCATYILLLLLKYLYPVCAAMRDTGFWLSLCPGLGNSEGCPIFGPNRTLAYFLNDTLRVQPNAWSKSRRFSTEPERALQSLRVVYCTNLQNCR